MASEDIKSEVPPVASDNSQKRDNSHLDKPKKQKVHKRKLKKMLAKPTIQNIEAPVPLPAIRKLVIELAEGVSQKHQKRIQVKEAEKVPNTVVCLVPGLLNSDFHAEKATGTQALGKAKEDEKLTFFWNTFPEVVPLTYPGKANEVFSPQRTLVNREIEKSVKRKLLEHLANTAIKLDDLLIKMPDWMDHDYKFFPGSGQTVPEDWYETVELNQGEPKVYALDCEFCQTKAGSQLARISVVDYDNNVVYDEYVKPEAEIIDYKTKFSGITEELMVNASTTEKDVREKLRLLISASDFLVGHSLLFDLNVLKMSHSKIIDTCTIYDHPRKKPFKASLKWLSETYLDRKIQKGEENNAGHSSVEDCIACLDLLKLKLSKGMLFGQEPDEEPISVALNTEAEKPVALVDTLMSDWRIANTSAHTLHQYLVENDDEAVKQIADAIKVSKTVFCKLSEYPQGGNDDEKLKLNTRLQSIWQTLPENSIFIVVCGTVVDPEIDTLQRVKLKFNWMQKQGMKVTDPEQVWDFDKAAKLKSLVAKAKESACFLAVKAS